MFDADGALGGRYDVVVERAQRPPAVVGTSAIVRYTFPLSLRIASSDGKDGLVQSEKMI